MIQSTKTPYFLKNHYDFSFFCCFESLGTERISSMGIADCKMYITKDFIEKDFKWLKKW
ncbi:MAG: hypothetical protein C5S49_01930 [Candidatus Methanogaster sp.]|nr:MAG: hypothetical protein C5S49_01930 [ANME-2 cluster archaeon]